VTDDFVDAFADRGEAAAALVFACVPVRHATMDCRIRLILELGT
jgi:hypothetical protein